MARPLLPARVRENMAKPPNHPVSRTLAKNHFFAGDNIWVLENNGTRNRCKRSSWVANVLLSARHKRLWKNGHVFVRKSPLQKPKLMRQLLQSQTANLSRYMHLC